VEEEIRRLRGLLVELTISVNVAGATVFVDSLEVGTSPLGSPVQIQAGRVHNVEARREGYRSARREVSVAEGDTPPPVELELVRLAGRLNVEVNVSGAQVYLDGQLLGPAPWQGEVALGDHQLEIRAEQHEIHRESISVAEGGEIARTVELEIEGGAAQLVVASDVEGAAVFLDGREVGQTPLTLEALPSGVHQLRVERQGYVTYDGEVALQAGRIATANLDLIEPDAGVHRAWFWSMLGLGLTAGVGAVIASGLTLGQNLRVNDFVNDTDRLIDNPTTRADDQVELEQMQARGQSLALIADVLWALTGAAAITTLVLGFFTRFHDPESTMQLEIGGSLGAESAMLTARGRF
jgi:hypothetical protein